eukprot:TRINITY_DN11914_c0_g1_i1.p2 TRINITY_DN11914_c0_g1~~TRINITY_DN11914_c0_g1_i1.p2  ORF type:complete len:122 (+),score=13.48 TRINITY_DN11914_c0_g1_i1:76-441(+)
MASGHRQNVAPPLPCRHNAWDNVRAKKGWMHVRCRVCDAQARLCIATMNWCESFMKYGGCDVPDCPWLHVHMKKLSAAERQEKKKEAEYDGMPELLNESVIPGDGDAHEDEGCPPRSPPHF